jgi:hypothetical protein
MEYDGIVSFNDRTCDFDLLVANPRKICSPMIDVNCRSSPQMKEQLPGHPCVFKGLMTSVAGRGLCSLIASLPDADAWSWQQ